MMDKMNDDIRTEVRKLATSDTEDQSRSFHRIKDGTIFTSEEVAPGLVFDYSDSGDILAVEVERKDARQTPATGEPDTFGGYGELADVINDAYLQAAIGKGNERHARGKPFIEQPILEIVRMLSGIDGHAYQIMKKAQEASAMVNRGEYRSAEAELFGIINYAAAAVIRVREIETEAMRKHS